MMIAVIIPTYNESGNIIRLLDALRALNIPDLSVWVVDDASPDGSGRLADSYASTNPQVSVIHRSGKLGLGSAYLAGFRAALHAGAEVICEMDADLSHDPNELPMLIEAVETGADAVVGSRKIPGGRIEGWGIARKIMSHGAMTVSRAMLNLRTKDVTNGYRCYRRRILESIDLSTVRSGGYAFQEEILYRVERAGFKVVEVPTIFRDRTKGFSKLYWRDVVEFFGTIIRLKL
ncbi:hypothetical protein A3F28_00010 [Candidatus Uhrbacteria bacterium RIFCSPHIGHO2_12_FULL_57_11]|uniref:Glycosyltransferase 2-like domain-containing protein n=2 Tax=Candidatus Uhriibacteriota TaxID=1752732 RepID=A0A1F7UJ35_9BACT|nr:MAG: hypothetical protein A3D72_03295 [Candidatus Uhrbacteria bacterium RIFCSPHIGHO2_02_FULL_57_19]OGL78283.1 MAG: hypothetical protein A3F28_00010 [Candidatus Uhrbacteria bacterium RIFCSPHIGHO2_12_FULL_57_11]